MVVSASSELAFRAQLVVPEQQQLYDYWLNRAEGRGMPSRGDISPVDFPDLLPLISLIDVDPDGLERTIEKFNGFAETGSLERRKVSDPVFGVADGEVAGGRKAVSHVPHLQ